MAEVYPFAFEKFSFDLEWQTSVLVGWDTEQRDQVRAVPRLQFNVTSNLTAEQAREGRDIFAEGITEFLLPDRRYAQRVKVDSEFVFTQHADGWKYAIGEQVCILYDDVVLSGEVVDVTGDLIEVDFSLTAVAIPRRAWIMPLWPATLLNAPTWVPQGYEEVALTFYASVTAYRDLSAYSALIDVSGYPVLGVRDINSQPSYTVDHGLSLLDNEVGPINPVRAHIRKRNAFQVTRRGWAFKELFSFEAELHEIAGRCNAFWKPSWLNEFVLAASAASAATEISIRLDTAQVPVQDTVLFFKMVNGNLFFVTVSDAVLGVGVCTLTISALPEAVSPETVQQIGVAGLHRFDTDKITFTMTDGFNFTASGVTLEVFND